MVNARQGRLCNLHTGGRYIQSERILRCAHTGRFLFYGSVPLLFQLRQTGLRQLSWPGCLLAHLLISQSAFVFFNSIAESDASALRCIFEYNRLVCADPSSKYAFRTSDYPDVKTSFCRDNKELAFLHLTDRCILRASQQQFLLCQWSMRFPIDWALPQKS